MPHSSTVAPSDAAPGKTALLIIDMISCWDFPDAEKLLPGASRIAPAIAALRARCRGADVPIIYANDNYGQWRSDFEALVERSSNGVAAGARITDMLAPGEDDYFVLKPKHSAFFATPMELLLRDLGVARLLLTGVASDQCVLVTAAEARMRDLDVVVPRDCVASQSDERNTAVLRQFEQVHKLETTPGEQVDLTASSDDEDDK